VRIDLAAVLAATVALLGIEGGDAPGVGRGQMLVGRGVGFFGVTHGRFLPLWRGPGRARAPATAVRLANAPAPRNGAPFPRWIPRVAWHLTPCPPDRAALSAETPDPQRREGEKITRNSGAAPHLASGNRKPHPSVDGRGFVVPVALSEEGYFLCVCLRKRASAFSTSSTLAMPCA